MEPLVLLGRCLIPKPAKALSHAVSSSVTAVLPGQRRRARSGLLSRGGDWHCHPHPGLDPHWRAHSCAASRHCLSAQQPAARRCWHPRATPLVQCCVQILYVQHALLWQPSCVVATSCAQALSLLVTCRTACGGTPSRRASMSCAALSAAPVGAECGTV